MTLEGIKSLQQKAGEIIINRYQYFNKIPDEYKELYINYLPPSCGIKRKFDEII